MKPKPHQRKAARKLKDKLIKYGLAILAGEVRSGKTLAFITAALNLELKDVLIITKKDAIGGIKDVSPNSYIVTNFHQVKNLSKKNFKLIIIDEFHRYVSNASPKRSTIWKDVHKLTYNTPIILSSGTPTPETYAMLYSSLALSCKSPWDKYKNFTHWFKDYGYIYQIRVNGYSINQYDRVNENKIKKDIEQYIVTITQDEAGHKFKPVDKLHHISLSHRQQRIYDVLDKDSLYELSDNYSIVVDTPPALNTKKHQISGGFVNTVNDYDELDKRIYKFNRIPKVKYIQDNFDVNKTIIVAYYKAEQEYLSSLFPHVESITKKSDGVDFSHFDNMIIYSFPFAAVTYEQIRARQQNFDKRDKPIMIHFLISGIDQYVYDAVSNKKNFTASWYNKNKDK